MPGGRPKLAVSPTRTKEVGDAIVAGISEGIPLRQLCRIHPISKSEVYEWMKADKEFAGRIARARVDGFEAIAEETLDIADNATNDWQRRFDDKGAEIDPTFRAEHVMRSKLRIETRLKLLAKWFPKKYGDKLDVEHSGSIDLVERLNKARERVKSIRGE